MMYFWNKKGPQVMTTGALGKRPKSKVKIKKTFVTLEKNHRSKSKLNKDFW